MPSNSSKTMTTDLQQGDQPTHAGPGQKVGPGHQLIRHALRHVGQGADVEAGVLVERGETGAGFIESDQCAIGQGRTLEGGVEVLLRSAQPVNEEDGWTACPLTVDVGQRKTSATPLDCQPV